MNHGKHLKYMLIAAVAVLAVLLLTGVSLTTALPYALLLACPLMMIAMMAFMTHNSSGNRPPHIPPQNRNDDNARLEEPPTTPWR